MSANTRERQRSGEGPARHAGRAPRAALFAGARRNRQSAIGNRQSPAESGQALILAVVIMLLLVFIGTLFLKTALSNLKVAGKSQAAQNEYGAAEAGVRFADTHLTSSEMGADWRPRPSYNITVLNKRLGGSVGNPAPDLLRDPDWYWIQPFNANSPSNPLDDVGGYVRYNLGDARFLLRVSYNPNNVATAPVMADADPNKFANGEFGPSALSRFIMIEAIGRPGSAAEIDQEYQDFLSSSDPIDPTVFSDANLTGSRARFRRELVAFKAIGINNYLRFVTDRDRLNRPTYFGVDQDAIRDGDPTGSSVVDYPSRIGTDADEFSQGGGAFVAFATGAPMRVNGDLVFYGNAIDGAGSDRPEFSLAWTDEPWNVLEVAGQIRREGRLQDPLTADPARMSLRMYPRYTGQTTPDPSVATAGLPASADSAGFTSLMSDANFANRYLDNLWLTADPTIKQTIDPRRSIVRLEGPSLEEKDPSSGMLRYEAMTRVAGSVKTSPAYLGQRAAQFGYGAGIYIDNARHASDHSSCRGDVQFNHDPERLRNEWLRPYATVNQAGTDSPWKAHGRIYEPPGVTIELSEDREAGIGRPANPNGLIKVIRTDRTGWRHPDGERLDRNGMRLDQKEMLFELQPVPGQPPTGNSQEYTLRPKYKDETQREMTWDWGNPGAWVAATPNNGVRYPFNGVIYAEGNIRIRGRLPMDTAYGGIRLTVVSRGTIYIDGNLIKGQPNSQGSSKSQIALLARDYVCLNTTAFVRAETNALWDSVARNGNPPFAWWLPPNSPDQSVRLYWDFGLSPSNDARVSTYYASASNGQDNRAALFLRHQAYGGPATFQWRVNGTPYQHTLSGPFSGVTNAEFYPLLNSGLNAWEIFADASALPFGLDPTVVGQSFQARVAQQELTGDQNEIEIQSFDPGPIPQAPNVPTTGGTYQIAAAAIQPLDVQITALIYAEHRSWFVIPGVFFQDQGSGDPVMQSYGTGGGAWRYPKDREPLDVQIHVVGAIAEGQAASLQDATLWTGHWRGANRTGYEAAQGDSDADWTFVKRGGINYAFDPTLITLTREVRSSPDEPAHFLPGPPRLPVCPGLVYFGERPVR